MTGLRVWQRALLLTVIAVTVVSFAQAVAGRRLVGPSTVRDHKHIVAVLADPSVREALRPVVDRWSARSKEPVRVEWVPSPRIVTRVLHGERVDVVVVTGGDALRRVRGELAERPSEVIRPGAWLGTVTDLGQPLAQALRRALPRVRA